MARGKKRRGGRCIAAITRARFNLGNPNQHYDQNPARFVILISTFDFGPLALLPERGGASRVMALHGVGWKRLLKTLADCAIE